MHSSISCYVQVWHETEVFGVKFIEQGKSIRAGPGLIRCQKDIYIYIKVGQEKLS